jgi:hypothetical protein
VSSRDRPSCRSAPRHARRRLPSGGALGPRFPTFPGTRRRYDGPPVRLGARRVSLASHYRAGFAACVVCREGSWSGRSPPTPPGLLVTRAPTPGLSTRRPGALPRARVTPGRTCPALRPRWWPRLLPVRVWDGCLPATGHRRLSPPGRLEGSPAVHDDPPFGAPSRGLPARALQLRTPIAGCARGGRSRRAGEAFVGWDVSVGSHPRGNDNPFQESLLHPKGSGLSWRDQRRVRCRGGQGHASHPPAPRPWSLTRFEAEDIGRVIGWRGCSLLSLRYRDLPSTPSAPA